MGNAASSNQRATTEDQVEYIDGGALRLQDGIYTVQQDWKKSVVRALQLARRLAPFYKGLPDYDPAWSTEELSERLTAHLSDNKYNRFILNHDYDPEAAVPASSAQPPISMASNKLDLADTADNLRSVSIKPFANSLYEHAIECPICFLFYPRNIATTRCCRQPICTECFVQIRRPNPHAPIVHADDPVSSMDQPDTLIMESPVCPYCNTSDFGVIYHPPGSIESVSNAAAASTMKREIPPEHESVVLTDSIRPDWAAKLQRAKDRAARRAANAALISAHLQRQERRARSGFRDERRRRDYEALEEEQIAEAIRLSMLDDEERRSKIMPGSDDTPSAITISTTQAATNFAPHSVPLPELLYAPPSDSYAGPSQLETNPKDNRSLSQNLATEQP